MNITVTIASIAGAVSIALSASTAAADVYKCVVDGKTTYQGEPCRGARSVMMISRPPASGAGKGSPETIGDLRAQVAGMEQQRRERELAYETDRLEREILALEKSRTAELAALRDKASFANYNQPGALWERGWVQQAIVAEMQAVNDKYDSLRRSARERLAQLGRAAAGAAEPNNETQGPR